ncbi:MAG: hypothetical protein SNJ59_11020 [Aggregatilineales bacterium]
MVKPSYQTYLEFRALRDRIEKRLPSAWPLVLHIALFILFSLSSLATGAYYSLLTNLSFLLLAGHTIWSFILCIHVLAVYSGSGATRRVRSRVIDWAMRERLDADPEFDADDELLFKLHHLLDRDIARRTHSILIPLAAFAILNALGSIYAVVMGAPLMFWLSFMLVLFISAPLYILLSWLSGRQEAALLRRFSFETAESFKSKRGEDTEAQAEKPKRRPGRTPPLISADGEMLEVIDLDADHDGEPWDTRSSSVRGS